jgi:phosphoribosyl 1,2-cyclic phosphodiesterase
MTLKFLSLSSGSSGNCYYLGTENCAILIDAGIPVRTIQKVLKEHNLPFDKIYGLLITHDHTDHIRSAGSIGELYHIPVYATREVHSGMERNYGMQKKLSVTSRRNLERDVEVTLPGTDFRVTPFTVPHDSTDNVGYYIEVGSGEQTIRFCLVTDVGHVTSDIRHYLSRADHVVMESNHDVDMLMNGPYPKYLKARVRGEGGHLSNKECAELIHDIYHPSLRHVFLCHLSEENNDPDLAYRNASKALASEGAHVGEDVVLSVLLRNSPSLIYTFGEY